MDHKTSKFYSQNAKQISDSYDQMNPELIYDLAKLYFIPTGSTLDIGCGSGRDLRYFLSLGFKDLKGIDGSTEMINEASTRSKGQEIKFSQDTLPLLENTKGSELYDNVLVSGVLMHLQEHEIVESAINLLRITKDQGTIIISFRQSRGSDARESDGRLFSAINPSQLGLLFETLGATVIHNKSPAPDKNGKAWCTLVIRKEPIIKSGLRLAQMIVVEDSKSSTYKLALLYSLIHVANNRTKSVVWHKDKVLVPVRLLAEKWLELYWPMLESSIKNGLADNMRFSEKIIGLIKIFPSGPFELNAKRESLPKSVDKAYESTLREIASTIVNQPAKFAGGKLGHYSIFSNERKYQHPGRREPMGYLGLSQNFWRDLSLFSHWIEPRVLFEWLTLLEKYNPTEKNKQLWSAIQSGISPAERTTFEIRSFFEKARTICTWTNSNLTKFDVDHVLPYALMKNNDLWNLLPADPKVNGQKSDKIPTSQALYDSKDRIFAVWSLYDREFGKRFWREMSLALAPDLNPKDTEHSFNLAFRGLIELTERLAVATGVERWSPSKLIPHEQVAKYPLRKVAAPKKNYSAKK